MTQHIMLDIESLGVRPGSVVLSAALVRFADEASTAVVLDQPQQYALGLRKDQATADWWVSQSDEAYNAAFFNPIPLVPALDHISRWIAWAAVGGDFLLWCHGASFDGPLLQAVYEAAGVPCPWQFWQLRDTRTLYDLAGVDPKAFAVGADHVALNDALAQTRAANAALKIIAGQRGIAA